MGDERSIYYKVYVVTDKRINIIEVLWHIYSEFINIFL